MKSLQPFKKFTAKQIWTCLTIIVVTLLLGLWLIQKPTTSSPATSNEKTETHKEGSHEEGKHEEGKHEEGKHEEGKHEEGKHEEGKHEEGKHEEGKHEEGKHEEGKHEEGKHEEGKHEEGKHEEGKHEEETVTITLSDEQRANAGLQTATVSAGNIASNLDLPGELKLNTDQESHVSSPFTGRVEAVYVTTGQSVKQGQALASLLIPQLVEMQSSLNASNSRLALAKNNYEREKTLWQQGISAKQDYLQAEHQWQLAQIEVSAAKQGLRAYGAKTTDPTGRFTLTAPTSGTVVAKDLTIGETIQPSNQLFNIAKLDALWIEFSVPPTLAGQLSPNMHLEIFSNTHQPPMFARLLTYTPSADNKTRKLIARARLEGSAPNLRPSMLVTVRLKGDVQKAPIVIDSQALQTIKEQTVVFVESSKVQGKTTYKAQPVTVGTLSDGRLTAISSGLTAGMRYVTIGSFTLKSESEKSEAGHDH